MAIEINVPCPKCGRMLMQTMGDGDDYASCPDTAGCGWSGKPPESS